jgi:tetratricopeptide (TPR) repeat protein
MKSLIKSIIFSGTASCAVAITVTWIGLQERQSSPLGQALASRVSPKIMGADEGKILSYAKGSLSEERLLAQWDKEHTQMPRDLRKVEREWFKIQLHEGPYVTKISREHQAFLDRVHKEKNAEIHAAMDRGDETGAMKSFELWRAWVGFGTREDLGDWFAKRGNKQQALKLMKESLFENRSKEWSTNATNGERTWRMIGLTDDPAEKKAILDQFAKNVQTEEDDWVKVPGHRLGPFRDMGAEAYMHSTAIGTLEAQGKPEEALKHLSLMVAANPNSLEVNKRAAEILDMHGKLGEAKKYAAKAYRMMPAGRERDLYANSYMVPMAYRQGPQP